jgi:hypothetical protein
VGSGGRRSASRGTARSWQLVSRILMGIRSPCLRNCVHGASIGIEEEAAEAEQRTRRMQQQADEAAAELAARIEKEAAESEERESFPHGDWVAVPKALRARRVNRNAAHAAGGGG